MALNLNQFGSILGGAAKGAARGIFGGPAGIATGGMLGAATSKGAQPAVKNATNIAGGALKGAAKGVLAGPAGISTGAALGAATSKSGQKVLGSAAKGALTGLKTAGPAGIGIGAGIGAIGGLFGGNKPAAGKPKAAAPAKPTPYTVQKGDTLTSIAKKQGTTVDAIRQSNPKLMNDPKYKKGNMIWSGTTINPTGPNNQKAKTTPKKATPVPNKAGGIATKTLGAAGSGGADVASSFKSIAGKMGML